MGRIVRKINTDVEDPAVLNDSDVIISYEGCGCAGGLVTTVKGESVPRGDQSTQDARGLFHRVLSEQEVNDAIFEYCF